MTHTSASWSPHSRNRPFGQLKGGSISARRLDPWCAVWHSTKCTHPSAMPDEVAGLQLRHRLSKFLLRIHNDGSVPGDRLFDRLTRDQQEPDALIAGLNDDLVSAV